MNGSSSAAEVDAGSLARVANLKGGGASKPADRVGTADVVKPFMRERQGLVSVSLLRLQYVSA